MKEQKEIIGVCNCPICGVAGQSVKLATSGKPYLVCDECGIQLFTRHARSVKLLRERMTVKPPESAPIIVTPPPAAPLAKPAPIAPAAPAAVVAPSPKPAAEKTIFDWLG